MDLPTIWQKTRSATAQTVNFISKLVRKYHPNRRVNVDRWAGALQLDDKAIHDIKTGSLSPSEPSLH
ncbi:MAG: hypothetical protein ACR2PZ_24655, partial [Pseudomonadales bacterium]